MKLKTLLPCHRSERYVITVEVGMTRFKIMQIMFSKRDGSLYVSFPYYAHSEGIASLVTWTPDNPPPANLSLTAGGKVTSHLVKYSHHPDGKAHFSQDGRVYTSIKKQSIPINKIDGHVFTVQVQGLLSFEQLDPSQFTLKPTLKRTILNFDFGDQLPETIKIVGRWFSHSSFINRSSGDGGYSPTITAINPQGQKYSAFVCSPPGGYVNDDRYMLLTCEQMPRVDKEKETLLLFIGAFDKHEITNDLSKTTTFLALSYPALDVDEIKKQVGSIDYTKV